MYLMSVLFYLHFALFHKGFRQFTKKRQNIIYTKNQSKSKSKDKSGDITRSQECGEEKYKVYGAGWYTSFQRATSWDQE